MSNHSNNLQPYQRVGIGFDHLFKELVRIMQVSTPSNGGYPPFNLEKLAENNYRITLAVAGFTDKDIEITQQENALIVSGQKTEEDTAKYLHRGIATRNFKREFVLGDRVDIKTAALKDGMLVIDLIEIVPEEAKPKRIPLIKE
jgi:molecular chaperone IbpA